MSAEPTAGIPERPGFYRALPYDSYAQINAVRSSILTKFRRSPAHAREEMIRPRESTPAQEFGTAIHKALLEPEGFRAAFVPVPKVDKRTTAGKAQWTAFQADNPGKTYLVQDEWDQLHGMLLSVQAHREASDILWGCEGLNELTAVWRDKTTDLLCKARLDRACTHAGWSRVVDIKTTQDASRSAFERAVHSHLYHVQAAHYLAGADALAPRERRWTWIVCEKEPPYAVAVYEIEQAALDIGAELWRRWLDQYAECQRTGVWPGYSGIDECGLPAYAYR